ncbi:MAG TPA: DUF3962 domain-containing protein [Streptosporangiaceae bacterium]|jgi:hypothetical protein
MPHSLIRRAAYEPDPSHGSWIEPVRVLPFDETWRDAFLRLYQQSRPAAKGLPVTRLNRLALAIAPGVITTGRNVSAAPSAPWLYARHEVPPEPVRALVLAWVRMMAPAEAAGIELDRALQAIGDTGPTWSVEEIDLLESGLTEGGTAAPANHLYLLLAEWLAARLATRPYRTDGSELRFRVVGRDQGAELVSWPPQKYDTNGRTWFYSATVTITVQTVPFDPRFRVHTSSGIRRWATGERTRPRRGRGATVLFDVPVPWPDLEAAEARLIPNSMKFDPQKGELAWRSQSPAELIDDLDLMRTYPKPGDLAASPERFIRGWHGIRAGIVFSEGMGSHAVGKGLMSGERADLDTWVEEGLRPYFRRVPDLERIKPALSPKRLPKLRDKDLREQPELYAQNVKEHVTARRSALRAALGGRPLDIEIFWEHRSTRDQVITDLSDLLGLAPSGTLLTDDEQVWRVAHLDVHVRSAPIGSLGAPLDLPSGSRSAALDQAIRTRYQEVRERLGAANGDTSSTPTLAFVEIGDRAHFASADSDPKYALRLGFARAGRLTQFLADADDTETQVEIRSRSACLDGFRQLGAVTLPHIMTGDSVPEDLQHIGMWLIQRNDGGRLRQPARRLIAVRIRPDDERYPVCGWDEAAGGWVPYPRLLLTLAQQTEPYTTDEDHGFINDRLAQTIQRTIRTLLFTVRDEPTLMLVNSANLRRAWPSLSNGRLMKDMVCFGDDANQRLSVYGPDLRLVLVRDHNGRDETAQWYAMGGGQPGFANGLWRSAGSDEDNRVFFSAMDVSPTAKKLPRSLRKLVVDPQWPTAPTASASNPQGLEVTVVGRQSRDTGSDSQADDPAHWASVVHQSRFHNDHHGLSRPFAQHLAWLAAEYVLPSPDGLG